MGHTLDPQATGDLWILGKWVVIIVGGWGDELMGHTLYLEAT